MLGAGTSTFKRRIRCIRAQESLIDSFICTIGVWYSLSEHHYELDRILQGLRTVSRHVNSLYSSFQKNYWCARWLCRMRSWSLKPTSYNVRPHDRSFLSRLLAEVRLESSALWLNRLYSKPNISPRFFLRRVIPSPYLFALCIRIANCTLTSFLEHKVLGMYRSQAPTLFMNYLLMTFKTPTKHEWEQPHDGEKRDPHYGSNKEYCAIHEGCFETCATCLKK